MNKIGKVYVVGIGPGNPEYRAAAAIHAIKDSDVVIGYKTYIELIKDLTDADKEVISSGMKKEVDRCSEVIEIAKTGKTVSLVSSGDAGIYGMAGILLEMADGQLEVEIVPGITAVSAAASSLGAPLMHDFAIISLSDLLTDWEVIKKRIDHASRADFVIGLYNPKSKTRTTQIVQAREIMLKSKPKTTPVGIVRNAKRENESVVITTLDDMLHYEIDMFTIVIIGNIATFEKDGKIITPRGYDYAEYNKKMGTNI